MRTGSVAKVRRMGGPRGRHFVLQWHVTARCTESCGHCYASDDPALKGQLDDELAMADCRKVIGSFDRFLKGNGLLGRVNLTGGDPLLKDGLFDIIKDARARGMKVGILGNPMLLDHQMARRLKQAGVFRYQVSIDGLEATHDRIRGRRGHLEDTLRAIDILNKVGIPTVVMFTVSAENASELPAVARLVSEHDVAIFDFSRLVPQGKGRNMAMLGPEDYRRTLVELLDVYKDLEKEGTGTHFGRKEALWNLLHLENGGQVPGPWDGLVEAGCSAGSRVLTVLADGTVYPCRRLPIRIGRVPKDEISDVFFKARMQLDLQDVMNFKKCKGCVLLPFCRGCPGVAYGSSGDPFAPDPQCWKGAEHSVEHERQGTKLGDHAFWRKHPTRQCASCDGACGGCGHVCAACSEVCASCSGCGDN